jgi:protein-disulfide isomerase
MPPVPLPKGPKGPKSTKDSSSKKNRNVLIAVGAAVVLAAVLIGASFAFRGGDSGGNYTSESVARFTGIPQNGYFLGKPDSHVALIEYQDGQCPVCKAYSTDVLPTVVDDYVRPGKVRLELRPYPFIGSDSDKLARYVAAASLQNKAWQVSELFYENQGDENSGWVTDKLVDFVGKTVPGLDVERWKADADGPKVKKLLEQAAKQAEADQVNGTPTFFVMVPPNKPEYFQFVDLTPETFSARLNDALSGS